MVYVVLSLLWIALTAVLLLFAAYLRQDQCKDIAVAEANITYKQAAILAESGRTLYWRLVEALPDCVVIPQIAVGRFVRPITDGRLPLPQYRALQDRLMQYRVDYLVCRQDFSIVAGVELDEVSQPLSRYNEPTEILRLAGVPLLRIPSSTLPTADQLRTRFTHPLSTTRVDNLGTFDSKPG